MLASFEDYKNLLSILNATYPIRVTDVRKHRDWIGYVYNIKCNDKAYILKIYRPFHSQFALFLLSYEKARNVTLSDYDVKSVYDFIAIRHYDIQATITECQGYTIGNLENQHRWLMNWRDLCERKIKF